MDRYDRQKRVQGGHDLDQKWADTSILLVGIGGVGCPLAQALVRSGIGRLTLIDGDRVRDSDLHRQVLYTEQDALSGLPKTTAAINSLQEIGGRTELIGVQEMLTPLNARKWIAKHDLVLDATDHIGVRSLIQQISLETGIGWIHSGAIADRWVAASFAPPGSPCYHCWVSPEASKADLGTCETEGVLLASCMAASAAVMRLLTELLRSSSTTSANEPIASRKIIRGSISEGEVLVDLYPDPDCPLCSSLEGWKSTLDQNLYPMRKLCGSGSLEAWLEVGIDEIKKRLKKNSEETALMESPLSVRWTGEDGMITCFGDGRALITGKLALDETIARDRLIQLLGTPPHHRTVT